MATDFAAKEIEKLVDREVRVLGFSKKGKKWFRTSPETICQLTLTKDRWRPEQSYLETYVSVIEFNTADSEEPVWHIFGRGFSPKVEDKVEWEKCLNARYAEVSGRPRQARLVEILREQGLPLLRSFETLDGVKNALFSNQLRAMGVRTELQDITGYRA